MLLFLYVSKKDLKLHIGEALRYTETSMFGLEYKANGVLTGSNRPSITGIKGREFFAQVTMRDNKIVRVE